MKKLLFLSTLLATVLFIFAACDISIKYKIEFYVDGKLYDTVGTDGETIRMPKDPDKKGYIFDGWFWDEDSQNEPFTINSLFEQPLSEDNLYKVYAHFDEKDYSSTVTADGFVQKDGILFMRVSNQTESVNLTNKIHLEQGANWYISSDQAGKNELTLSHIPLQEGDNFLYIQVENISETVPVSLNIRRSLLYKVTFETNGGTQVDSQIVEEGKTVSVPASPTKNGYQFREWKPSLSEPINDDTIFTAQWEGNLYSVTFDPSGGDIATQIGQVTSGQIPTFPIPEKTGYTFEGWYIGSTRIDIVPWSHYGDATVTAKWAPTQYQIRYEIGSDVTNSQNPTYYTIESPTFELENPIRPGAKFDGWFTDEMLTKPAKRIEQGSYGNIVLYPKWNYISYDITYHLDGGTQNPENQNTYTIETFLQFYAPTKKDFMFRGWYDNPDFIGDPISAELCPGQKIGNFELWAKWQYGTEGLLFEQSSYGNEAWKVSGYTGSARDVVIPSIYSENGKEAEVIEIGIAAFQSNKTIRSVDIPSTVRHINTSAFSNCTNLKRISPLTNILTIGIDAFYECYGVVLRMTDASAPENAEWNWATLRIAVLYNAGDENCTEIDGASFWIWNNCATLFSYFGDASHYTIPDNIQFNGATVPVTEIAKGAFALSELSSVTIPQGIQSIGMNAFAKMPNLEKFRYEAVAAEVTARYETVFGYNTERSLQVTIGSDVPVIPSFLFYQAGIQSLEFENGVDCIIDESAFEQALLPQVLTLSSRITEIGSNAFEYADFEELRFEQGSKLKLIDSGAFQASQLKRVFLPNGLKTINSLAFSCGLDEIYIPISVQTIESSAITFSFNAVADIEINELPIGWSLTFPHYVTVNWGVNNFREGDYSYIESDGGVILTKFYGTIGASFVLPDTLGGKPVIGFGSFFANNTELAKIVLPSSLKEIGYGAFWGCTSLYEIEIPASVEQIDDCAFVNCFDLTSITFQNGSALRKIGREAFRACTSLAAIDIPANVTEIGVYAFYECSQLKNVSFSGNSLQKISDYAFLSCGIEKAELPDSVSDLGREAFGYSGLTYVHIPNGIRELSREVFRGCTNLTEITGGTGLEIIGIDAFFGCQKLSKLSFAEHIITVGEHAFSSCSSLTEWNFSSIQNIGYGAFSHCGFTEIILPASLQEIANSTFDFCGNLVYADLSALKNITSLPSNTFQSCSALKNVVLPANCTYIGEFFFSNCKSLIFVALPDTLQKIGSNAFENCTSLTELFIPLSVTFIGQSAFSGCSNIMLYFAAEEDTIETASLPDHCIFGWTMDANNEYVISFVRSTHGMTQIDIPKREGYKFCGWFKNPEFIGKSYMTDISEVENGLRLYAKWEKA